MFWIFVCLTAAGAFGAGMAFAQVRLRVPGDGAPDDATPPVRGMLAAPPRPASGDVMDELFAVSRGDVVVHMGQDHVVAQVERWDADGHHVVRAAMEMPDGLALLLTDNPTPRAALGRQATSHALGERPPDALQHGGFPWRRVRRMEARRGGRAPLQVHLYEGPDGLTLWAFVDGGNVEVWEGRALQLASTMVLRR